MTDRWRDMGSILDISPEPAIFEVLLPEGAAEERLRRHWERVGEHFSVAMGGVAEDVREPDPRAAAPEGKTAKASGGARRPRSPGSRDDLGAGRSVSRTVAAAGDASGECRTRARRGGSGVPDGGTGPGVPARVGERVLNEQANATIRGQCAAVFVVLSALAASVWLGYQPVDKAPRMGIRPRSDGEPHPPGGCGALSPQDGGPDRVRDPFRRLSRGGRTLPAPLPSGASRRVGARGTFPQPVIWGARGREQ